MSPDKNLIRSESDLDTFISCQTAPSQWQPRTVCKKHLPTAYPCVICYHRETFDNGPDEIFYEFIYLSDFED